MKHCDDIEGRTGEEEKGQEDSRYGSERSDKSKTMFRISFFVSGFFGSPCSRLSYNMNGKKLEIPPRAVG